MNFLENDSLPIYVHIPRTSGTLCKQLIGAAARFSCNDTYGLNVEKSHANVPGGGRLTNVSVRGRSSTIFSLIVNAVGKLPLTAAINAAFDIAHKNNRKPFLWTTWRPVFSRTLSQAIYLRCDCGKHESTHSGAVQSGWTFAEAIALDMDRLARSEWLTRAMLDENKPPYDLTSKDLDIALERWDKFAVLWYDSTPSRRADFLQNVYLLNDKVRDKLAAHKPIANSCGHKNGIDVDTLFSSWNMFCKFDCHIDIAMKKRSKFPTIFPEPITQQHSGKPTQCSLATQKT